MNQDPEEHRGDPDLDPILAALVVAIVAVLTLFAATILRTGPTTVIAPPAPRPISAPTPPR